MVEHPVFGILKRRGQSIAWLARESGLSANYLYQIKGGYRPVTSEVRRRVSDAMQLPEQVLFLPSNLTEASEPDTSVSDGESHDPAACRIRPTGRVRIETARTRSNW